MRWLADECVDGAAVARLRAERHDVVYIAELGRSFTDAEVIELAQNERRLLVTEDKDFGALVFRQRLPVPGLVLLRIAPGLQTLKQTRLHSVALRFGEGLFGRYTTVEEDRFRSRPLQLSSY